MVVITLREECRLKIIEKSILRRIFRAKGDVEKAPHEQLHSLYRSPNIVRVIEQGMEEGRSALKILTSKPTGKRP